MKTDLAMGKYITSGICVVCGNKAEGKNFGLEW